MVDKLSKYCKYGLIGLMALNIIFAIIVMVSGQESVGTAMGFAYCMLGLTVVAILFAPIYGIIINPKSIKSIGLYIAIAAVVALLAWLLAKGSTLPKNILNQWASQKVSRHSLTSSWCSSILLSVQQSQL